MRDEIKGLLHRNRICLNVARVVESELTKKIALNITSFFSVLAV